MARILPRRRPGLRIPRVRRARRWTAQKSFDTLSTGTLATAALVSPADYQQTATLEAAGVTLARIRGCISISTAISPTAAQVAMLDMMVYVAEADSANVSPFNVQALWQEEVLWYQQLLLSGGVLIWPQLGDIDIRAKRKLDNHEVRLAVIATAQVGGAFDYYISTGWRALLIGG